MCLYPRLIKNKKYTANKKNGGIVPVPCDMRVIYVPVACGKCIECLKKKGREWQIRMSEEIRNNNNGKFITLTFNEESLKKYKIKAWKKITENKDKFTILENEIATIAMREFLERWRKKYKKSIKHWFTTELGHEGTERIHMHGIIWTDKTRG